jgi:hypothetical protein
MTTFQKAVLEILGSIINGFALPLKEEHKVRAAVMTIVSNNCYDNYMNMSAGDPGQHHQRLRAAAQGGAQGEGCCCDNCYDNR